MNIEINQENSETLSIGTRLRQAREKLGLSQQVVAERLCLMLSTVRDIEEDRISPKLAQTFARGYVRSYAKLVEIPEDEVLSMMPTGESSKINRNTAPMQSFSYAKKRKKRDGWLMLITMIIVLVVIGLTGAWWWENYKAQQKEIEALASGSAEMQQPMVQQRGETAVNAGVKEVHVPLMPTEQQTNTQPVQGSEQPLATQPPAVTAGSQSVQTTAPASSVPAVNSAPPATAALPASETAQTPSLVAQTSTVPPTSPMPAVQTPGAAQTPATQGHQLQITPEAALQAAANQAHQQQMQSQNAGGLPVAPAASSKALAINFTADCWIEVRDVTGKELVSTLKRKGSSLELEGEPPYKLKLGAPSAVQITYQGSAVDLGDIAKSHQVVRLTIPLQP